MSNPYTVESLLCEAASANSLPKANRAAALAIEGKKKIPSSFFFSHIHFLSTELSRRDRKEQLKLQRSQQETTAARGKIKKKIFFFSFTREFL